MTEEVRTEQLKKIDALYQNDGFEERLSNVASPNELVELFRENGVEIPMNIAEELFVPSTYKTAELNDEDLDNVSGGGFTFGAIGSAVGNGIFYAAGYLGARIAGWDSKKSKDYASKCGKFGAGFGGIIGGLIPVP